MAERLLFENAKQDRGVKVRLIKMTRGTADRGEVDRANRK